MVLDWIGKEATKKANQLTVYYPTSGPVLERNGESDFVVSAALRPVLL